MEHAECAGISFKDPDYVNLFFPKTQKQQDTAITKYCGNCPVISECGKYADETNQQYGIWGGVKRTGTGVSRGHA